MGNYAGDIIICLLVLFSLCLLYGTTHVIKSFVGNGENIVSSQTHYSWIIRFLLNFLGYATVLLPGYLIYKYVRISKYLQRRGKGCLSKLVHSCFVGSGDQGLLDNPNYSTLPLISIPRSFYQDSLTLIHCFLGLQVSYLTWGYLQEKIMTQEYDDGNGNKGHFKDSQFLVFTNRVLAVIISTICLLVIKQPPHTIPLYKYSFCSLSNVLSSWCQYEALKYVSFPTQVLAKASKIIPVMIMSKIVSRSKEYDYFEYVTAVLISIGMMMFMFGSTDHENDGATTFSGIVLLGAYMTLDSFTSNWQNALFTEYGVSSVQMMCAVNIFSCLLTASSLFQQSSLMYSLTFMTTYPRFVVDSILLSIFSTTGLLYIYYTIYNFGAVTFTIMMTVRQCFAILLSCLLYHHYITSLGAFGIFLVFFAVFLKSYFNYIKKSTEKQRAEAIIIKNKS